jgi:hypothetical protein
MNPRRPPSIEDVETLLLVPKLQLGNKKQKICTQRSTSNIERSTSNEKPGCIYVIGLFLKMNVEHRTLNVQHRMKKRGTR